MNFGGVIENIVTKDEFTLEKAREVLKNETIAVIGYGIQGPGQAGNLRDNGFNVIVGQRKGKSYDKAVADGWVPGKTLFSIEEAAEKGTIIAMLLSDAGQISQWPTIKKSLTAGKTLYYSHGFAINWQDRTVLYLQRMSMSSWLPLRVPAHRCALCSLRDVVLTLLMLSIRMHRVRLRRRLWLWA